MMLWNYTGEQVVDGNHRRSRKRRKAFLQIDVVQPTIISTF
jgi:hypothetical protein